MMVPADDSPSDVFPTAEASYLFFGKSQRPAFATTSNVVVAVRPSPYLTVTVRGPAASLLVTLRNTGKQSGPTHAVEGNLPLSHTRLTGGLTSTLAALAIPGARTKSQSMLLMQSSVERSMTVPGWKWNDLLSIELAGDWPLAGDADTASIVTREPLNRYLAIMGASEVRPD